MLTQEEIIQQQELLRIYRTNLAHALMQAAQYGGELSAPLPTFNTIREARDQIQRIKEILRTNGVVVDDHPNDNPLVAAISPSEQQKLQSKANKVNELLQENRVDVPKPPDSVSRSSSVTETPSRDRSSFARNIIISFGAITLIATLILSNQSFSSSPNSASKSTPLSSIDGRTAVTEPTSTLAVNALVQPTSTDLSQPIPRSIGEDIERIAFASKRDSNYEIYVMEANGSNPVRLTMNDTSDYFPAWSPDGQRIAFNSDRDGNYEIYVMQADGSNETRLTKDYAADFDPVWSPDGQRIAFKSLRDGNYEIYVMHADGSNPTRLTTNDAEDSAPAWSPDGKKIAFASSRDGKPGIFVMQADGSNLTRLTTNDENDVDVDPAWSPDGKKIAFASTRAENYYHIYVMQADGSNLTRLTTDGLYNLDPSWSPDGQHIVFSRANGGVYDIYVMQADGSNLRQLTSITTRSCEPS